MFYLLTFSCQKARDVSCSKRADTHTLHLNVCLFSATLDAQAQRLKERLSHFGTIPSVHRALYVYRKIAYSNFLSDKPLTDVLATLSTEKSL